MQKIAGVHPVTSTADQKTREESLPPSMDPSTTICLSIYARAWAIVVLIVSIVAAAIAWFRARVTIRVRVRWG